LDSQMEDVYDNSANISQHLQGFTCFYNCLCSDGS
jgi:hypothetical protein